MAGRLDRGDRYVRNDRSRSYRDRREAVGRDHGNPPSGNHYGNQNQGFRDRRDRDHRDRDVRDVREELPALRRPDRPDRQDHRQDRQEPRRESARGRPNLTPRNYDDDFRHDSRYRRGKGGHVNDRDRHDQYSDERYVHHHPDRYAEQHDWEHHERDRSNRERYPERDFRPNRERDQRLERDRFDRRPDRDPDRDRQDRHGFRDERDTASGDRGGRRRQDYDVHRHGEERHVDYREADYQNSYNDVANHSRSRRVRKVMVKERKPDVRLTRDRGEAATASGGFREDEREARAETARGDYVQPGSDRPRRARDVPADRRPKLGQRPRQDRSARDRKAREEGPRQPREQEAPGRDLRRSDASKHEVPAKADISTPKPPSQNQEPQEEHAKAPEKPGAAPEQPPEASGQSGAQSPEEGETGSSESSSDDCNSQADFSGSEENFAVAVAEEAQTEQPAKAEAPASNVKDGKTDSVMEPVEGRNGSQSDTSRSIPVPKHLCKQVAGLCAASQTKFDIQDKTAPFARVTVSGSEKAVETVLTKIRVLGHRSHDAVELCVAKNAQGQLQGWTQEKIGRATQASASFSHDKDNLRIALKGAPAAVDKAWLLVVKAALGKAQKGLGPDS